jgi:hypothetical protein
VVYTDGEFVYDPEWSSAPIPRRIFEAEIRRLNGPTIEITFVPAKTKDED